MNYVTTNNTGTLWNIFVASYLVLNHYTDVTQWESLAFVIIWKALFIPVLIAMMILTMNAFVSFFTMKKRSVVHIISCIAIVVVTVFKLNQVLL